MRHTRVPQDADDRLAAPLQNRRPITPEPRKPLRLSMCGAVHLDVATLRREHPADSWLHSQWWRQRDSLESFPGEVPTALWPGDRLSEIERNRPQAAVRLQEAVETRRVGIDAG